MAFTGKDLCASTQTYNNLIEKLVLGATIFIFGWKEGKKEHAFSPLKKHVAFMLLYSCKFLICSI